MPTPDRALPPPHGGRLIDTRPNEVERRRLARELPELPSVVVESDQLFDAAKIGVGAFSPLDGFMDQGTLRSVLMTGRLPDGEVWPMPVFLSPPGKANAKVIASLRPGDEVVLRDARQRLFGVLELRETFALPHRDLARGTYGTISGDHPNVQALYATGDTALAGRVRPMQSLAYPLPECELTPAEARTAFEQRGWHSVAAYQTRNVPHRGHEQLQRMTLEREDIDGLFIHPVIGSERPGEYRPQVVRDTYRALIGSYLPADRVLFGTLTLGMRYAGPRAALFFAIVRKNYGCSHYIVGRDQAGVNGYYDPYACHRIFDDFPIGMVPLRYRELAHCGKCGGPVSDRSCPHPEESREPTSQTRIRRAISEARPLPLDLLRPEVARILQAPAPQILFPAPLGRDGRPPEPTPTGEGRRARVELAADPPGSAG